MAVHAHSFAVLEEQVEAGIFHVLRPADRNTNCVCFMRTISDVDKHVSAATSSVVERYTDIDHNDDGKVVRHDVKKKALQVLRQKIKVRHNLKR